MAERSMSPEARSHEPAGDRLRAYESIQILRFMAAVLVVASHAVALVSDRGLVPGFPRWSNGHAGVDIFFVISGFVMSLSLDPRRRTSGGWRVFLVRRLQRILPLYWIATTLKVLLVLVVPSMALHSAISAGQLASSYLFLPALLPPGTSVPFMPVGWTLNFEMFFYALCALALAASWPPTRAVGLVLCGLALSTLLWPDSVPPEASYRNPIVLEFLFGMLIARWLVSGAELPRILALGMLALGSMAILLPVDEPSRDWRWISWGGAAALLVLGAVGMEPHLARVRRGRGPAARLLQSLSALGDSSYALYLSHTFVVPALGIALARHGVENPWALVCACVAASVAGSVAIHFGLERRMARAFRRPRRDGGAGPDAAGSLMRVPPTSVP